MKKFGIALLLLVSVNAIADDYVRGHTRKDGTYVQPHYRSERNEYKFDKYSSQGNTNPHTGERGSNRHEFSNPSLYDSGYGNNRRSR